MEGTIVVSPGLPEVAPENAEWVAKMMKAFALNLVCTACE
jgi:hypothetical protein